MPKTSQDSPKSESSATHPEHARKKRLVWFAVGITTAVIVAGWVLVLPISLRSQTDATIPLDEASSGWNRFLDNVGSGFRNFQAIFDDGSSEDAATNAASDSNSNTNSGLTPEEQAEIQKLEDDLFSGTYK